MSEGIYDYDAGYYHYEHEADAGEDGSEVSGRDYRTEYDSQPPEPEPQYYNYDYYDYEAPEGPPDSGEGAPVDSQGVDSQGIDGNSAGVQPVSVSAEDILCKDHMLLLDTKCVKCSAVKVALGPNKLKELGVVDQADAIPEPAAHFDLEHPDKKVTLVLDEKAYNYGKAAYFRPPLARGKFEELIKDYCHLSFNQHSGLMKNLDVKKFVSDIEKLPNNNIFKEIRELLLKSLKNKRYSECPLLVAVSVLAELIRKMKNCGQKHGLQFRQDPPQVEGMGPKVRD